MTSPTHSASNNELDDAIRSVFDDIVDATDHPERSSPRDHRSDSASTPAQRRWLTAAATVILIAGAGGLVLVSQRGDTNEAAGTADGTAPAPVPTTMPTEAPVPELSLGAVQPTQEYWVAVWDAREIVIGDCMQQLGHEYRPRPNDAARPTNESVGTWDDWNLWRSDQASGDPSFEADLFGSDLDAQAGGCQLDAYLEVHGPGEEAYSKAAGLENELRAEVGSAALDQPAVDRWVEAHDDDVASVRTELDEELVTARSIIEGADS